MVSIETNLKRRLAKIRSRCYNPNDKDYKNYGGRGIRVWDGWREYKVGPERFVKWALSSGFKIYLTIQRIDNDGNYHPDNCTWATRKEQVENRRTRPTIKISYNGKEKTIIEWSDETGLSYSCIHSRFKNGEEDLFRPPGERFLWEGKYEFELCEELGLKPGSIHSRLDMGWAIEKAVTTPKLVALKKRPRKKHLIEYIPIEQKLTYLYDTKIHKSPCGSTNMKAMYLCGYCGKETEKFKFIVKQATKLKSCGCMVNKKQYPDDYVPKDSWLTFIKRTERRNEKSYALYRCKCENIIEKNMFTVKNGTTRSCGCMGNARTYVSINI